MSVVRVKGLGYMQIVKQMEELVESVIETDPDTGLRAVTTHSLDTILESCDDPDHARDPLAQAVYNFILSREAKIVLPDS